MSINSQLSKNNSIRLRDPNATPLQHSNSVGNQHSTTPTPRESIVFNRGDERPIAKILLSTAKSSSDTLDANDGINGKIHKSVHSMNSITDDEELIDGINARDSVQSRFYLSNHDRMLNSNDNLSQIGELTPSNGNKTMM